MSSIIRKRKKSKEFDIELTSLIDIVTILLVFLLQSSSVADYEIKLLTGLELPSSETVNLAKRGITVQMNKNYELYIEDKLIGKALNGEWETSLDQNYVKELDILRQTVEDVWKNSNNTERFYVVINLLMDKTLDYKQVKRIMDLSAGIGMEQFKFVTMD